MTKENLLAFYYEVRSKFESKGMKLPYSTFYLNSIIHARSIDYKRIVKELNEELLNANLA